MTHTGDSVVTSPADGVTTRKVEWGSEAHIAQTRAAADRLLAEPGFLDRINEEAEEYERTADPATRWTPIEELGIWRHLQ